MEPENHLLEKENHLNQTFIFRFHVNFQGVICPPSSVAESFHPPTAPQHNKYPPVRRFAEEPHHGTTSVGASILSEAVMIFYGGCAVSFSSWWFQSI